MNQVLIDPSADSPRVIVVERRSLLAQIGGVWFVALPLIAAYLICRVPFEVPESSERSLRLGDNAWQQPRAATLTAEVAPPAASSDAAPAPVDAAGQPRTVSAVAITRAAEPTPMPEQPRPEAIAESAPVAEPPAAPAAELVPQGVVVIDSPRAGANPVAVFDPNGNGAKEAAEPENQNRTLTAALDFGGAGQPSPDETRKALEEINAAAETARIERERTESLKPLIAMHEQAQAKARETQRAEAIRRKAAASREEFLQSLGSILASGDSIPQQGRKIDLMVRSELDTVDFAPFQPIFVRLNNMRASRAGKLRYLLKQRVPECLILSFLIEIDSKDIGKSGGPRDKDHAIVRSADFLLSNLGGQ